MFATIKSWFIKEEQKLESILAPLENIKANLQTHIHNIEVKIEEDATKAAELLKKNIQRVENNVKANTVVKNLESLFGINTASPAVTINTTPKA